EESGGAVEDVLERQVGGVLRGVVQHQHRHAAHHRRFHFGTHRGNHVVEERNRASAFQAKLQQVTTPLVVFGSVFGGIGGTAHNHHFVNHGIVENLFQVVQAT